MRRLALLALIVPLTAGCGWANLLLAPSYSYSSTPAVVHHECVMVSPGKHTPRPCVIPVRRPSIHRGCMAIGPDGMPRPCVHHGPAPVPVPHGPMFRSCGEVGVGIGWHLSVFGMGCHAGTKLVHRYFSGSNGNRPRTVLGYRCVATLDAVRCQRGASIAVFVGNH